MNKKSAHVLGGNVLITALVLMIGTHNLHAGQPGSQRQLVLDGEAPLSQVIVPEPGYLFVIEFDLYSLDGEFAGKAVGRFFEVTPSDKPSTARRLRSDFTFNLPNGQVKALVEIRELSLASLPQPGASGHDILQIVEGTITAGSGDYTGATGTVRGGGATEFTPEGVQMNLRFVLNLR